MGVPLVSIVIVNFNGAAVLRACLESVFAQPYRPIEVIVVDNASTDGSPELVRRLFPGVLLLRNQTNRGFAAANNIGVAQASGEYVVLLNSDTTVEPGWLPGLLKGYCRPGVRVVTSRVVTEGVPQEYYEMNGTINYLGYNIMREFKDLSCIFFAGGASLLFEKAVVGPPFLPEYFLYHEDVYLSWKLMLAGYHVAMAQESVVRHVGSAATRRQPSALVTYYQERNRLLNSLLFFSAGTLARLVPYFVVDAVTKTLLSLVVRRKSFIGVIRSYWWVCAHIRWVRAERSRLQATRAVPDNAILSLMSCKIIDNSGGPARLVNRLSKMYANLVGLSYHV